uniref:Sensory/regulatory protein RpfC n=1 Tax=Magnetococcus massalia (strain MO-1) TaxID=451514 RepID=A0A1S7LE67_MAGMO
MILLWLLILTLYLRHLAHRRVYGVVIATLLTVLAIDAFRTLFESLYFGLYFNAKFGFLPEWFLTTLGRPEFIFIPKFINVLAGVLVVFILFRRWLPKQLEADRMSRQMLVESEARFRAVTQSTHDAIIAVDSRGDITFWNRGAESLFGYLSDEMLGKPALLLIPDEKREGYKGHFKRLTQHGCLAHESRNLQIQIVSKSGEQIPVELSLGSWMAEKKPYFSAVIRDIREREKAQQALIEKERAIASNLAKSEFLATMSHEIRTPMNAIIGASEMLLETDLTSEQRHYIDLFSGAGENLLQIINDILDISKIEAGNMPLEHIPFSPHKVVRDAQGIVRHQAVEKGIMLLGFNDVGIPPRLLGDPSRIRQIMINFLGNAVKFTEQGSVTTLLRCRLMEDGRTLLILSVVDTGIGIPESFKEHIFHAFSQVDASVTRKFGGSGLGLAISQRLAQLMEGTIRFSSVEGQGSSFSIELPLDVVSQEECVEAHLLNHVNVLIKHDHPIRHSDYEEGVARMGASVTSCDNSVPLQKDLARYVVKHQTLPDLLVIHHDHDIADALLAELAQIRSKHSERQLPILVCGMFMDRENPKRLQAMKVDFVLNPHDQDLLQRGVLFALERRGQPSTSVEAQRDTPLNLLIVDDSEDNLMLLKAFLKGAQYRLTLARNGQEAVEEVTSGAQRFDLVLMDVQMPELDGYSATRMIRQWEQQGSHPPLPIVALTAHAMSEHVLMSEQAGCSGHLTKPIKKQTLLEAIESYRQMESEPEAS